MLSHECCRHNQGGLGEPPRRLELCIVLVEVEGCDPHNWLGHPHSLSPLFQASDLAAPRRGGGQGRRHVERFVVSA